MTTTIDDLLDAQDVGRYSSTTRLPVEGKPRGFVAHKVQVELAALREEVAEHARRHIDGHVQVEVARRDGDGIVLTAGVYVMSRQDLKDFAEAVQELSADALDTNEPQEKL